MGGVSHESSSIRMCGLFDAYFDKDMVSASLQERYGLANSQAGRLFLEKIIQVPLQLPAIEKDDLRNYCFKAIDESLKVGDITLSNSDVQNFLNQFQVFEKFIKTPRQAKLYSNILMFSLPILKGEVNIVDLMLIEALRVFTPDIYMLIRENREVFLHQLQTYNEDKEKERRRELIDERLKTIDINNVEEMKKMLKNLFPILQSIYGNTHYGNDSISRWEERQRICSDKYFLRYFSYSIPKRDLSDIKLNSFLSGLEYKSIEDNNMVFESLVDEENVVSFISKLRMKIKTISDYSSQKKLAKIIALNGNMYPNPNQLFQFSNTFSQAAILLSEIIMNQNNKNEKIMVAKELINIAEPLNFATEIFTWLRSSKDEDGNKLEEQDLKSVGIVLANKITTEISSDVNLMFSKFSTTLYYWNLYGEENKAKQSISDLLKSNPEYILNLLKQYLPSTWSGGIMIESSLERETYDALARDTNVKDLIGAIKVLYSELPPDENYPEFIKCSHDEKIARQFIWLHNHVQDKSE